MYTVVWPWLEHAERPAAEAAIATLNMMSSFTRPTAAVSAPMVSIATVALQMECVGVRSRVCRQVGGCGGGDAAAVGFACAGLRGDDRHPTHGHSPSKAEHERPTDLVHRHLQHSSQVERQAHRGQAHGHLPHPATQQNGVDHERGVAGRLVRRRRVSHSRVLHLPSVSVPVQLVGLWATMRTRTLARYGGAARWSAVVSARSVLRLITSRASRSVAFTYI